MDDLSAVEDLKVNGAWVISAEQQRDMIRWAQKNRHANCFFQRLFTEPEPGHGEKIVCCVYDLFDDRWPTMSVTNDAEFVTRLAYSSQEKPDIIIYRDTEGNWDELRHREGYFACFRALSTKDQDEAIRRVLALHEQDDQRYVSN